MTAHNAPLALRVADVGETLARLSTAIGAANPESPKGRRTLRLVAADLVVVSRQLELARNEVLTRVLDAAFDAGRLDD